MLSSLYSARARRDADGFTLIELLVVVIVIGLLAAIALPIFIDQQKQAVDASVKSDVRNTVTNVNSWLVANRGIAVADTDAFTSAANGGKVAKSRSNTTVGVAIAASGSYTVCAYNDGASKYTTDAKAWRFDSATGAFGLTTSGTCEGVPGGAAADSGGGSGSTGGSSQAAPAITTASLPNGTQNATYAATLQATGNPTPTFELASGSTLPTGMTLTGAQLGGTPTVSGTFSFTIVARNSVATDSKSYTITLASDSTAPTWATAASLPQGTVGTAYKQSVVAAGNPTPTYTMKSGSTLPPGLTLSSAGEIAGTPNTAGTSSFTIVATNGAGSVERTFTLVIGTAADNSVLSYDFENGTQGWYISTPDAGTTATATTETIAGRTALKFASTNAKGYTAMRSPTQPTAPLVAGKSYTLSAYIYIDGVNSATNLKSDVYSGMSDYAGVETRVYNSWQKVSVTFTASNPSAGFIGWETLLISGSSTGLKITAYLDDVKIIKNN